ncbi:MAG: hypothetical protein ABW217_15470 [Polyangiaceae bacterium]
MERQRAGRIARWVVIGVGVIVLGCGGDAGTGGADAPDPTESNAAAPAVGALLAGASECVWVPVTECRSSIALGDWCGTGFYTATLQSCPDVGSTLSSVTAIYSSFRLGGCSPCVRHTMHVSVDAVECCPDGIPGTPVPDEADL